MQVGSQKSTIADRFESHGGISHAVMMLIKPNYLLDFLVFIVIVVALAH